MSGVMVDGDWLEGRLGSPGLRVVEAAYETATYEAAHIPGAVAVDWRRRLMAAADETDGRVISPQVFADLMGSLGIRPSHTVVCYGDQGGRHALRLLWTLAYYGHPSFRVLEGGRERWQAEGRPMTSDQASIEPSSYPIPSVARPGIRASWRDVLAAVEGGGAQLLDVRTRGEYEGGDVRADRGGRIPGAVWLEWSSAVDEEGALKPLDELRRLVESAGLDPQRPVITYCQLGVRAAHTWFVLRHVLGFRDVRNYDGSWQEWGNRADLPIER